MAQVCRAIPIRTYLQNGQRHSARVVSYPKFGSDERTFPFFLRRPRSVGVEAILLPPNTHTLKTTKTPARTRTQPGNINHMKLGIQTKWGPLKR